MNDIIKFCAIQKISLKGETKESDPKPAVEDLLDRIRHGDESLKVKSSKIVVNKQK